MPPEKNPNENNNKQHAYFYLSHHEYYWISTSKISHTRQKTAIEVNNVYLEVNKLDEEVSILSAIHCY